MFWGRPIRLPSPMGINTVGATLSLQATHTSRGPCRVVDKVIGMSCNMSATTSNIKQALSSEDLFQQKDISFWLAGTGQFT